MNNRKKIFIFLKYIIVFIIGGFVSSELSIRNSRVIIEGEPTIYYARILISDDNNKPISNAEFTWLHSISIKPKEPCTSVINEYEPGKYVVVILGTSEDVGLNISINKDSYIPIKLEFKAMVPGQSYVKEKNLSSNDHLFTVKLKKSK